MAHLAQLNIAKLLYPIEHPKIADFRNNIDKINTLGEQSKGFVWRYVENPRIATGNEPFADPWIVVNLTVWESIEDLKSFAFNSEHVEIFKERAKWFEKPSSPHMVLWWIPEGKLPTLEEAEEKLELLEKNGDCPHAFTFKKTFEPELKS
ncbi:DUF3291 domain-containing protein [Flexithrix dorotheae]|uniref:DUF3291 domain-containing protein n=1 Tax=Flexithrix dorotheae TaxID=70993 RepID=UPI000368953F|nr:DUF3291 domain-containing protein [Flexithrix dorotheae]